MTARLMTSNAPFEWVDGNDRVTWTAEPAGIVAVDPRECGRIMIGTGLQPIRYPFSLELSQFRDQISGTLRELRDATTRQSDIAAPVTGFVRLNGTMVLEATLSQPNHEPFRVINWASAANAAVTTMSARSRNTNLAAR